MPNTLLIVDDIRTNRAILKSSLGSSFQILEAENGQEALAIIRREYKNLSAVILDLLMPVMDGYAVMEQMQSVPELSAIPIIVQTAVTDKDAEMRALSLGAVDFISKPYNPALIRKRIDNIIKQREAVVAMYAAARDDLTGLLNRKTFFEVVAGLVSEHDPGHYVMACFDVDQFKVINDQFGTQKGDEVLKHLARVFEEGFEKHGGICARIAADNFAVLYPASLLDLDELKELRRRAAAMDDLAFPIVFSIGRYLVDDLSLTPSAMYDRATLAAATVKGRYDAEIGIYSESMRDHLIREQAIVMEMESALDERQFEVWYQPQYNHATGALIGAEALVRWRHPQKGLIPPSEFVPLFEQNGFIYVLDQYVWQEACRFLQAELAAAGEAATPLPVSVNISRYDIFRPDIVDVITSLVRDYGIPVELLRLEITESAFAEATEQIITVVKQLIDYGFTLEIDDFGSGYSSLNTLKNVPAQVVKLDMRFLEESDDAQRSGNIIESIVRMTKWLGMSVIAEGVEQREQADFLRSIGCNYVQGFLYARPMPQSEYEALCRSTEKEEKLLTLETVENLDNSAFWDPKSMDTLIFNSYVGGACIFEYHNGEERLLRVNKKYIETFGKSVTGDDIFHYSTTDYMDAENKQILMDNIRRAIDTGNESTCETCATGLYGASDPVYIRSTVRVIARAGDRYLLYCVVTNTTAQREAEMQQRKLSEQLQAIMDNVDVGVTAIVITDASVRYLFSNDRYYSMLGYTREQFHAEVGDPFLTVAQKDRARAREETRAVSLTQKPSVLQYRLLHRDGHEIWFNIAVSTGRFIGVDEPVQLSIYRDITADKLAEQELMETDEQLRFLNETAHELLAQPDPDAGIRGTLAKLMEYFKGSRAYIFEFDYETETARNSYEVCMRGVSAEMDTLQAVPFALMKHWFDAFAQQGYYAIEDIAALDNSRAHEKEMLLAQRISSLFVVPLKRENQIIGMIGVDDPHLPQTQIERLMALGDYIAVMLTRRDLNARIQSDNRALQGLMDDTPGGFARIRVCEGGEAKLVYFNERMCELLGTDRAGVNAMYAADAFAGVHPDDLQIVHEAFERMLKKGKAHSARYRLRTGDGSYVPVMIFGRVTHDQAGDTYLNIYYTDVTDQVKEEERQKELLDNMPGGAALYEIDGGHLRAIHLNKRYWELVNRAPVEYENTSFADAVHPDDRPVIAQELAAAIRQQRDVSCDLRVRYGAEGYRPFHVTSRIIPQGNGKYSLYATYTPISDEAISYQQMLPLVLSAIMEATTDLAFAKDQDFRYICASRAFARMAGFESESDVIGKTDYDLFEPQVADKFRHDDEELVKNGVPLIDMVEAIPSSDGVPHYSSTSKYLLRGASGAITGLYGVGRDITEFRDASSKLRLLTDHLPGGVATYEYADGKYTLLYCNDGYCRLFEATREEYAASAAIDPMGRVLPEDLPLLKAQLRAQAEQGTPVDCSYRVRTKNGLIRWIDHKSDIFDRRDGKFIIQALLQDVTKPREMLERLRVSEEENALAIRLGKNIICRYIIADRSLVMSNEAAATNELPPVVYDVPDGPIREGNISPESVEAYRRFFESILSGAPEASTVFQQDYLGTWRWLEARSATVFSDSGEPLKAVITFLDITERLEKEAVYRKWQQSLEDKPADSYTLFCCNLSKDASFDTMEGSLLHINFNETGLSFDDRTHEYAEKCVLDEDKDRYIAFLDSDTLLAGYYRGKRADTLEYREKRPNGGYRWLKLTVELVEYPSSSDVQAYLMYEDIHDQKRLALQTREMAEADPLTGVLNRKTFCARVSDKLRAGEPGARHALLMLDIDGFKQVNDAFGHAAGDQALIEIADSLKAMLRRGDLLGRLGGDEFLILLSDIPSDAIAAAKARQILAVTRRAFSLEVQITGSVGIALAPHDGVDYDTLYKRVDAALYYVKGSGKNNYAFYHAHMEHEHLTPDAADTQAPQQEKRSAKRRMLIVDDNALDHVLLSNIFKDEFMIEKARDGESALIRLKHYGSAISVMLLDLMMPGMDGFAVLEQMQQSAELKSIPVIVVSGDDSRDACLRTIRSGATDFVTKPVDAELLRIRVQSAISKAENERLRAKNSLLELQNEDKLRYEAALGSPGLCFIEHDWLSGAFRYYPSISAHLAGRYDERSLWRILLSDMVTDTMSVQAMQRLVHTVAEDRMRTDGSMSVQLKTPAGSMHRFRMNVRKLTDEFQLADKLIITLVDLDIGGDEA